MNIRNWSIRSKIIILLLIPLLALVILWGFATSLTVPPAVSLFNFRATTQNVGLPAEVLVTELQRERRLSLVYLGGRASTLPALDEQRVRTDEAASAFRRAAGGSAAQDAAGEVGRRRIALMFDALGLLPSGRSFIDRRDVDRLGALGLYNGVLDTAFRMLTPSSDIGDPGLANESRALNDVARARELLTRQDALVSGAIVSGGFADGETAQVIQLIGMQRYLYAASVAELSQPARTDYQRLTESPAFVRLRALEDRIVTASRDRAAVPVDAGQWQRSFETVVAELRDFEVDQGRAVTDRAEPVAVGIVLRLALAGIVGLLAVVATVLISLRIGRSLANRLAGLRREALDLAENRLPDIVGRLRRGEEIDLGAQAPPLQYGLDEIGQVGRAFTEVQRTAVKSAVDEAELRRGLNEVFLNIARRSQTLVHRQLALFDTMERRATEPEDLECLFRVDHLATRMRRHAEDLVILAGAAPGRGWRNPVPAIDVIRGAVSEVEEYARVSVQAVEEAAMIGPVVGDIIHLLAELIENATAFSPPNTKVRVTGQGVPNGYVVEVEDRGLGMPSDQIAEANERLAAPPEFDPANSARMGLFVVAKLANRHGVAVQLRPSPYGGITAVVLVPGNLVVAADAPSTGPRPVRSADARPALPAGPAASPARSPRQPAGAGPVGIGPDGIRLNGVGPEGVGLNGVGPDGVGSEGIGPDGARPDGVGPDGPVPWRQPVVISVDGLPRRVRQASIAPQLKDASAPPPDVAPGAPSRRTPEQVRSRMSALQAGTRQGRIDGEEAAVRAATDVAPGPGDQPDTGPGNPPAAGPGNPPGGQPDAGPDGRPGIDQGNEPDTDVGSRPDTHDPAESGQRAPNGTASEAPTGAPTGVAGAPAGGTGGTAEEEFIRPPEVAQPPALSAPSVRRTDPEEDA